MQKTKIFLTKALSVFLAFVMSLSCFGTALVTTYAASEAERGDFEFLLKDESTGEELTGVLFRITNNDTGESHYFVTDSSGQFMSSMSSYSAHTAENANGNDAAVTVASDGTITVDESLLSSDYGIWFSDDGTGEIGEDEISEDDGALTYDEDGTTYTITEIRTSANTGYSLKQTTITLSDSQSYVVYGTLYNRYMSIDTSATVTSTVTSGHQTAPAESGVDIKDSVTITNAETGKDKYYIVAELVNADTEEVIAAVTTDSITVTSNGQINESIVFEDVDLTGCAGERFAVYIYLYDNDTGLCVIDATDASDYDENIYVPSIETSVSDTDNGTHVSDTDESVTITDTFDVTNIIYGITYTVIGVAYVYEDDESEAEPLYDANGDLVTASTTVKASATDYGGGAYSEDIGSASGEITMTFDSSLLDGKTAVIYEYLYINGSYETGADGTSSVGELFAWETSASEEEQTIHFPQISTSAVDVYTDDSVGTTTKTTQIIDTVTFENLVPGHSYKLEAAVYDEDGNKLSYTAETEFTLSGSGISVSTSGESGSITSVDSDGRSADGYVTVTIDSVSASQGDTYVVYETLYIEGTDGEWHKVSDHEAQDDETQTIHYPQISTEAEDISTGDDVGRVTSSSTIVDTVNFENLIPGEEYTLTGTLYNRTTGGKLTINGSTITASTTFTIDEDGNVEIISSNSDSNYGKTTGVDSDGRSADGYVTVTFTGINAAAIAGTTVVVYQSLYHNGVEVASCETLNDDDESVHYADMDTVASDLSTDDHVGTVLGGILNGERSLGSESAEGSLIDEITLENLVPGRTYTLTGVVYDADTGNALQIDGAGVSNTIEFTVTTTGITVTSGNSYTIVTDEFSYNSTENSVDAVIELYFDVDTSGAADMTLVVYEYLYHAGVLITAQVDSSDFDESVFYLDISTHAVDSETKDHAGTSSDTAVIEDTVELTNLVEGEDYRVEGYLVYAEDYTDADGTLHEAGEAVEFSGTDYTTSFDADDEEWTGTLTFNVDSTLLEGATVVVYENVYHVNKTTGDEVLIITHNDINSYEQSVFYAYVDTDAEDSRTSDDVGAYTSEGVIVDTVSLSNLVSGYTYTITGKLCDQDTESILTIDGGTFTVTAEVVVGEDGTVTVTGGTLLSSTSSGYTTDCEIEIAFEGIDTTAISDQTAVVYEYLYHAHEDCEDCWTSESGSGSIIIADHTEILDAQQSVHYAYIDTVASDEYTKDHVGTVLGSLINAIRKLLGNEDVDGNGITDDVQEDFVDEVTLTNLVPGRTYTLTGILMDEGTGDALLISGETVTESYTFTVSEDGTQLTFTGDEPYAYEITKTDAEKNRTDCTITIKLSVDTTKTAGITVTAYEYLYHEGVIVGQHTDLTDTDQQVSYPEIKTHAVDSETLDHVGTSSETAEITDTVNLQNLIIGEEYTVTGYVVYSEDFEDAGGTSHSAGDLVSFDKTASVYATTFTATAEEMEVDLTYTVDSTLLEGTTVVVYEEVYHNNVLVITHNDITSEEQSVYYPLVETSAEDGATADDVGEYTEDGTIIDTVTLTNLLAGNTYTLTGKLYDQDSGSLLEADGETFTTTVTVTVDDDGTVSVTGGETVVSSVLNGNSSVDAVVTITFTGIDTTSITDHTAVVYEYLYHAHEDCGTGECWMTKTSDDADILTADHTEILDKQQSVHYLSIDTVAVDTYTGDHVGTVWGDLIANVRSLLGFEDADSDGIADAVQENITETVELTNLVPGRTYTITGTLVNDITGEAIVINDEEITETFTFTVSEDGTELTFDNGSVDSSKTYNIDPDRNRVDAEIVFTFSIDTSVMSGKTAVVFEDVTHQNAETGEDILAGQAADKDDTDESVYYPEIKTHAADSETKDHVGTSSETAAITDTVRLDNLVVGEKYTVTGYVVYSEDYTDAGGTTHSAGDLVSFDTDASDYTTTFTATASEMEIELTYTVDSTLLEGTTVVVYEEVYHDGVMVITHNDITSYEQSVYYPYIETSAVDADTADDVGAYTEDGTIIDTVTFTNLLAGMEYTVKGVIMDQSTGLTYVIDGRTIAKEVTLTVSEDGTVTCSDENETVTVTSYNEDNGSVSGTVTITFTGIDTTLISGETAVVYEYLYHSHEDCDDCWMSEESDDTDILTADHTEILDTIQSVHYTAVDTEAVDSETGTHAGSVWGRLINRIKTLLGSTDADGNGISDDVQQSIIDTVSLTNLVPGKSYTVSGILMDADTQEPLLIDGEEITQSVTFTVAKDGSSLTVTDGEGENAEVTYYSAEYNTANADIDLVFTFDSSLLKNEATTIVVYENVYHENAETGEDILTATHEDIADADQSIYEISVSGTATDSETKDHVGTVSDTSTINAVISMEELIAGDEYTVVGYLIDQNETTEDGFVYLTNADGTDIIATTTITAAGTSDTAELAFTFSNELVQGKTVTVIAEIYYNNVLISTYGYTLDDDGTFVIDPLMSVYYPTGKTNASDADTQMHTSDSDHAVTITDTVYFQNLVYGEEYTITGTLHYADDFTDANGVTYAAGDEVAETHVWEAILAESGDTEITCGCGLTFTSADEATAHWEEYYALFEAGEITAAEMAEHVLTASNASVIDHYECAVCGAESETGVNGTYTDTVTFTASDTMENAENVVITTLADGTRTVSGYITLTYTVDTSDLAGATLVSFAAFTHNGTDVYVLGDTDDLPETIKIPEITTSALADTGLDEASARTYDEETGEYAWNTITITDTVSYSNLWTQAELDALAEDALLIEDGDVADLTGGAVFTVTEYATYAASGYLVDQETGEAILDNDGNMVTAYTAFTPDTEDGTVDVVYTLDLNDFTDEDGTCRLEGITLTVYEDLYQVNKDASEVTTDDLTDAAHTGEHKDTSDEGQSIGIPMIRTVLSDSVDGDTDAYAASEITLIDTITYTNLTPGREYTASGILYDPETGEKALDDDGNVITAQTTFTPEEADGTVTVTFTFPGTSLAGETLIAYETVTASGAVVGVHADITDTDQMVFIPAISTTLADITDNVGDALADGEISLVDTVDFENILIGRTYVAAGVLYDQETGLPAVDDNGDEITAQTVFMVNEDGTVTFFTETTEDTEEESASETSDTAETADDTTSETAEETEDTSSETTEETASDTVSGTITLTAVGYYDSWTGKIEPAYTTSFYFVTEDGTAAAASFADDADEAASHDYYTAVDASLIEGVTVKAYAYADAADFTTTLSAEIDAIVTVNGSAYGDTYVLAEITVTSASEDTDGTDTTEETETTDDTVYEETADSTETVIVTTLDATTLTASGSVTVTFTFSGVYLAGSSVTAFETITRSGKTVAAHQDITDEAQTADLPAGDTYLISETGSKMALADDDITLIDTVYYENLTAGRTYTVSGILMDLYTGEELLDDDGNTVTAETVFTAEDEDGSVEITYSFSGTTLEGTTAVSFVTIYSDTGKPVYVHEDLYDDDQSVYIPYMNTWASDGDYYVYLSSCEDSVIVDSVYYENLIAGEEYTVSGSLYDAETGTAILDEDGEAITSSITFTAEDTSGTIDVEFEVAADTFYGAAVVFEEITEVSTDTVVAAHEDLADEDQTVYFPMITTYLADENGSKDFETYETLTLTDTVTYTDLEAGAQYKLIGVLYDAATGEPAVDADGDVISGETVFTAEESSGTAEVEFVFETEGLDGTYVATETLYLVSTDEDGGEALTAYAAHFDLEDEDQTVTITYTPKTGDETDVTQWIIIGICALLIIIIIIICLVINRKRKESGSDKNIDQDDKYKLD